MAKTKAKSGLRTTNKVLGIILIVLVVVTALIIIFSAAPKTEDASGDSEVKDVSVLDSEFKAGTYGGVEFKTQEDLVKYYADAYNKTKAKTAKYKTDSGEVVDFYDMLGEETLNVENLLVDGNKNETINKMVPGIVGGLFTKGASGLPPSKNRRPSDDKDEKGQSLQTCRLVNDDVLASNVVDNKDGTITITIQPKMYELSTPGLDCQGHMFNTLGDITGVVKQITILKWAQGDASSNIKVYYMGGTGSATIDTKTGEIVNAEYHEVANISVSHASITIIKDKNATLTVKYDQTFPASDEYLKTNVQLDRVK